MNFGKPVRITEREIDINDVFDDLCPFCNSKEIKKRSSYVRRIQDLGSPLEKILIFLTVRTYDCIDCKGQFTPEHPFYPPKYEFSQAIIEYALARYNYNNNSGNEIANDLRSIHQVDVSEVAVYSWLKKHSPEYIKSKLDADENNVPQNIKAISVDGSYTSLARDIIGKKKDVESLSVTKLENGQYLLMWWE